MPYIPKDQIVAAREMDLLTYLRRFEPEELVHIGGDTYPAPPRRRNRPPQADSCRPVISDSRRRQTPLQTDPFVS